MKLDKDVLESIIAQAQMTSAYYKEMLAQGFSHSDAMALAASYIESHIKASTLASIEMQRLELQRRSNDPLM